jgi:endonuclease/exonuclease/phosphatase family metal-dependent hydrolase
MIVCFSNSKNIIKYLPNVVRDWIILQFYFRNRTLSNILQQSSGRKFTLKEENLMRKCQFVLLTILTTLLISTNAFAIFKVATYNIRNYNYDRYAGQTNDTELVNVILGINADLLAVQEIRNLPRFQDLVNTLLPQYKLVLSKCGGTGQQKLGFLYKPTILNLLGFTEDLRLSLTGKCYKGLRPVAIAKFNIVGSDVDFLALSVHLKAGGYQSSADKRSTQYSLLTQIMRELKAQHQTENFIVAGDFNTTDYIRKNHNYRRFIKFQMKNRMEDMATRIACSAYWWGGINDGLMYPSVLDHVMFSHSLFTKFNSFKPSIGAHCGRNACKLVSRDMLGLTYASVSDHCPMSGTLY